jgi:hypothetical protein
MAEGQAILEEIHHTWQAAGIVLGSSAISKQHPIEPLRFSAKSIAPLKPSGQEQDNQDNYK